MAAKQKTAAAPLRAATWDERTNRYWVDGVVTGYIRASPRGVVELGISGRALPLRLTGPDDLTGSRVSAHNANVSSGIYRRLAALHEGETLDIPVLLAATDGGSLWPVSAITGESLRYTKAWGGDARWVPRRNGVRVFAGGPGRTRTFDVLPVKGVKPDGGWRFATILRID